MKPSLVKELALDALLTAIWRRRPKAPLMIHSDQGVQVCSDDWQRFCRAHRIEVSMSRRGNCWDNSVAESFFSSLRRSACATGSIAQARKRGAMCSTTSRCSTTDSAGTDTSAESALSRSRRQPQTASRNFYKSGGVPNPYCSTRAYAFSPEPVMKGIARLMKREIMAIKEQSLQGILFSG